VDKNKLFILKERSRVHISRTLHLHQSPATTDVDTVFLPRRSSESAGSPCVFGMKSLSIRGKVLSDNDNIIVFAPTDCTAIEYCDARKGQWMQIFYDRFRFDRRFKRTELLLGNFFSNAHREKYLVLFKLF